MKSPLTIFALCTLLFALGATLFAQTTTGSSLITEMKAGVRAFTLTADLNPGTTGLQSSPVAGKVTGDMLTANEYNRLLELVAQGGGGGGASWVDIALTDTAEYDTSCMYRITTNGASGATIRYSTGVGPTTAMFGWNMITGWIGGSVLKGDKSHFTVVGYTPAQNNEYDVLKMEKLCAGSGGGGGTGGTGTGGGVVILDAPVSIIHDIAAGTGTMSLADKVPACATSVILGSRIGLLVGNAPRANDAEAYMSINNTLAGHVYLDAALHHTNAYDVSEGIFALSSNKSITWAVTTGGNFTSLSKYIFLKGYICGGTGGGTTQNQIVRVVRNWGWTGVSSHLQSISGSSAWEVRTAAWDERCIADGYANGGWIIDMDATAQVGFCVGAGSGGGGAVAACTVRSIRYECSNQAPSYSCATARTTCRNQSGFISANEDGSGANMHIDCTVCQ